MKDQNSTLEQLTLTIIEKGLSGGTVDKERIERIGEVLDFAIKLSKNHPRINEAIHVRYEDLAKYRKSEIEPARRLREYHAKQGNSYISDNEVFKHELFSKVYRLACEVLEGRLNINKWKSQVEELDRKCWENYELERHYKLFE